MTDEEIKTMIDKVWEHQLFGGNPVDCEKSDTHDDFVQGMIFTDHPVPHVANGEVVLACPICGHVQEKMPQCILDTDGSNFKEKWKEDTINTYHPDLLKKARNLTSEPIPIAGGLTGALFTCVQLFLKRNSEMVAPVHR